MILDGVGITQRDRHDPFQIRLKFGKNQYCVVDVTKGEEHQEVAEHLRELADQVERLPDL
jgi:hypothetical protein